MDIKSQVWTIKKLISYKNKINPKPQYQRTSVWPPQKKKLLIDSILRGYDIPKFYIALTPNDQLFTYEVTDGQQRMRAIWEFTSTDPKENYTLNESLINNINIKGFKYSDLQKKENSVLKNKFLNFEIHISVIKNSTTEELRTLFARLQMGERLNPAELRHAIASNIGTAIFSLTENHKFFEESKIPNARYKHQDYLDHVITLAYYDCQKNIKASEIRGLYTEHANSTINQFQPLLKKSAKILDFMQKINSHKKGIFKNKWAFVDTFFLMYRNFDNISDVRPVNFAESISKFETKRRINNRQPERLIEDKKSLDYDKDMYDYIIAFKTSGAEKGNILIRHRVFTNYFLNDHNFSLK